MKKDQCYEPLENDVIKLKTSQVAFNGGYKFFEFDRILGEETG